MVGERHQPRRRELDVEPILFVSEQIGLERGEAARTERFRHDAIARALPPGIREDHESDRALGHSETASQWTAAHLDPELLDCIMAAQHDREQCSGRASVRYCASGSPSQ
jgi:hypothetical protein